METLARELREVLGIKRVTTFQNLHAFAKKIKPREIQDIITAIAIIVLKNRTREIGVLIDSTGFQIMNTPWLLIGRCVICRGFIGILMLNGLSLRGDV